VAAEHPSHLRPDPFAAGHGYLSGELADRRRGRPIDLETEHRGEADRAEHPQLVLADPQVGVTDRPHDTARQVGPAPDEIDNDIGDRVVEQTVDRVVPATGIPFGVAVTHMVRTPPVTVGPVAAEGRDLRRRRPFPLHPDHPERSPERQRPPLPEQLPNGLGRRVGRDVKILRRQPQQPIADAAPG